MFLRKLFFIALFALALGACDSASTKEVDVSDVELDLEVTRLENSLFACKSEQEVLEFLRKNPSLVEVYFSDFPSQDSLIASQLYQRISNPDLQKFKTSIDSIYTDFDNSIAPDLREALKHLRHYYPDAAVPKVQTMVTGFMGNDLYVSDSLIIIGLDYFGGANARYRPDVFDYQLSRYQKQYIVPSILFFMSHDYNHIAPTDVTLLSDMIWYGKGYEFVKYMSPEMPDSLIIGYSEENLRKTYNSQMDIWAYFTSNKLLYETSEQKKQKYVGERPYTHEIGDKVPGSIGRWLGWRIVSKFVEENPDVSLQELMLKDNSRSILENSGYKGQVDN